MSIHVCTSTSPVRMPVTPNALVSYADGQPLISVTVGLALAKAGLK